MNEIEDEKKTVRSESVERAVEREPPLPRYAHALSARPEREGASKNGVSGM